MRLFIAINFDDDTKMKIYNEAIVLKDMASSYNFSSINNYHLTLAFLGEVDKSKVDLIRSIIDSIPFINMDLKILGYGSLKRDDKELIFRYIKVDERLFKLVSKLKDELISRGFNVDMKRFKPHLTISRETKFITDIDARFIKVDEINTKIKSIDLMESFRINGVLKYRSLYKALLK